MVQGEGIGAGIFDVFGHVLALVIGNHGFAAAAIACHGVAGDRVVRRDDAERHQRVKQQDKAGGMAPRHAD